MESIKLIIDGKPKIVQLERYFLSRGEAYLIYSDNDVDADGNVKIYIAKISPMGTVEPISSDKEWASVKEDIIGIVKDNDEQSKLRVVDLDPSGLDGKEITSTKALRLPSITMPYLSANVPDFGNLGMNVEVKKLDEKREELKNINEGLNNLMGEIENQVANNEDVTDDSSIQHAEMEIVEPSQNELSEEKKDGKFSFKKLFDKKEKTSEEEVKTEESQEENELNSFIPDPVVDIPSDEKDQIKTQVYNPINNINIPGTEETPSEADIQMPEIFTPEVTDNNAEIDLSDDNRFPDINLQPISLSEVVNEEEETSEEPIQTESNEEIDVVPEVKVDSIPFDDSDINDDAVKQESSNDNYFDFLFETTSPIVEENKQLVFESKDDKKDELSISTDEDDKKEVLELLNVDDEEQKKKCEELEKRVSELEKELENYKEKFEKLKNIMG